MKVYIEKVKFYHYLFIKYYVLKGYKVYVFDFNLKARKKKWLRDLIDKGSVYKIHAHFLNKNQQLAIDNIENIYKNYFKNQIVKDSMINMYGDSNIEMAFKKDLTEQLSTFYAVQVMLDNSKKNNIFEKIILIPDKYLLIQKIIKRAKGEAYEFTDIIVPVWAYCIAFVDLLVSKYIHYGYFIALNIYLLITVLLKVLIKFNSKNEQYDYAVAIINPEYQFKRKRTFDFLLDDHTIRKDNTIFIALAPLDQSHVAILQKNGYAFINCLPKNVFKSRQFTLNYNSGKSILKKLINYFLRTIYRNICEDEFIISSGNILLYQYVLWKIILNNYYFKNYITFNDENMRHIARNVLLKQNACTTWYYTHSSSLGHLKALNDKDMNKYRHWLWCYLLYDYYLGNDRRLIDFQKMHIQNIKKYVDIGCIWSSLITKNDSLNLEFILNNDGGRNKSFKNTNKIIAVFDTSYPEGIGSDTPLKDGIRFYKDMFRLLTDNPAIFMIIKEKKPESGYASKKSFVYSPSNREYSEILNQLREHPRAYMPGTRGDSLEIIQISDLVITHIYSSSTVEALGARKKAIFYEPKVECKGTYYDTIYNLVAHGYDDLNKLVHNLIYNTSVKEYEQYLTVHILDKIEGYVDGNALVRFRELLQANKI